MSDALVKSFIKNKITEDILTVLLYFSYMQFYINVHNQWWKAHIFYFK